MAFPPHRHLGVDDLVCGDELFLTTTRGCFRSPTHDSTRIIGKARVTSSVSTLDNPLELADRIFDRGCDISIEHVAPFREGVELLPLVPLLDAFPNKRAWSAWLRRPLLGLSAKDARLVARKLQPVSGLPDEMVPTYLDWIQARARQRPTS
jgi:hypothetical protein